MIVLDPEQRKGVYSSLVEYTLLTNVFSHLIPDSVQVTHLFTVLKSPYSELVLELVLLPPGPSSP